MAGGDAHSLKVGDQSIISANSKIQTPIPEKQPKQKQGDKDNLRTLNRHEVRAIVMARTRMIQCKRNYKNKYANMT